MTGRAYGLWCFTKDVPFPACGVTTRRAKRLWWKSLLTLYCALIAVLAAIFARQARSRATIAFILTEANALFVFYALRPVRPKRWTGLERHCPLTTLLKRFCRINLFSTHREAA